MGDEYTRWFCKPKDLRGLDANRARDLIIECFFQAQHETMTRIHTRLGHNIDEGMLRREAEGAVRKAFKRTGGNFDSPDKQSLTDAVMSLAQSALRLGTPPDIIDHHRTQIGMVLNRL